MYSTQAKYNQDEYLRRYLAETTTKAEDEARFKLLVDMTLESYRKGTGLDFKRWFFVHGMWALNGSDRDVCTIDREIGLLLEKGCLGDFTFPAGRVHTDPVHKAPFFCKSVDLPKCYDQPQSEPGFAYGSPADGRFFIWSSLVKHQFCSIDYYSKEIRAGFENLERIIQEFVQTSMFLDGTLYLKTHAHSMNTDYFDHLRRPIHPHFHPGAQAMLGVVFDAASEAGLDIEFLTAGEVYDRFVSASYSGSTDLASGVYTLRHHETSDAVVNAMTPLERLEAFAPIVATVSQTVVGRRLDELGITESGAYEYYKDLFERNLLIHPYELAVARYLAQILPDGAPVHEFGTGFGSMALLLAVAGYHVLGIDADPRRLATAAAIRGELGKQVPWVPGRLNLKNAAIPKGLGELDGKGVTVVATDVTSGISLADLASVVEATATRYDSVVFDAERFLTRTRTPDEMRQVCELFLRHYPTCEPVTSDSVGRFFFHAGPAASTAPLAPEAAAASTEPAATPTTTWPLPLDEAVAVVDVVGVDLIKSRIEAQGVEDSGAGGFYARIVEKGRLAQGYDVAVARWVLDNLPETTPLLEVGAGVGALSLVLGLCGRRITALDLAARRIEMGREIKRLAGLRLGRDLADLDFLEAKFPVDPPPVPRETGVVLITNMVFGWSEEQQRAMLAEIARFGGAIIDADRFGVRRSTPSERDAFDALINRAGFTMLPLDLAHDTRFVRLSPHKPQARAALAGELTEVAS